MLKKFKSSVAEVFWAAAARCRGDQGLGKTSGAGDAVSTGQQQSPPPPYLVGFVDEAIGDSDDALLQDVRLRLAEVLGDGHGVTDEDILAAIRTRRAEETSSSTPTTSSGSLMAQTPFQLISSIMKDLTNPWMQVN